ncbi:protein RarD [Pseudoclavibacter endophyticus]|uniref:EamA family transporter RarD n=1 Tax=Pseudoclavibacter endophyticus TaxID=1778590 RepID=UPI0019B2A99F|nr:EamA family transporter RarD [Pseudoclavibacter endophyticus]GGA63451.1 protein RarD [Pseudoclavibacter endophyticus]
MNTSSRAGVAYAALAYGLWGFLPLYIALTTPTSSVEFIGWRILLSALFCAILLAVMRGWRATGRLFRDRRVVGTLALAGTVVAVNWFVYVFAVMSGHTVEASLGYFLNPIVSVVLGLVVLKERLRPLQWAAAGVAVVAVLVLAIGYGSFPWIALVLACSFGFYGLIKKRVGARAGAIPGFFVETTLIAPIGLGCLAWALLAGGGITLGSVSTDHTAALLLAGVVTSLPLLAFAAAAKRLTLVEVGMMQFIAPITQFLIGVFVFGESMPPERWAGFAIVWVALACFAIDLVIAGRRRSAATGAPMPRSPADAPGRPGGRGPAGPA